MKALLINGSARANGNTRIALEEVGKTPCTSSAEAAQTFRMHSSLCSYEYCLITIYV